MKRILLLATIFSVVSIITLFEGCSRISPEQALYEKGEDVLDSMYVREEPLAVSYDTAAAVDTIRVDSLLSPALRDTLIPYSATKADSIVSFAKRFLGKPYKISGADTNGFDCSGFTYFVMKNFGIELPRSSYIMVKSGLEVPPESAQKGDLIFFRGTSAEDPVVGHVGIIVSERGEDLNFIHSSSASEENGVKITNYRLSNYDDRFVSIRRVLGVKLALP